MTRQHTFSGGLILESHKHISPIETPPLSDTLIYPLLQRTQYLLAQVSVNEYVLKGQCIAIDPDNKLTPLHAASSGTVTAIEHYPMAQPSGETEPCIIIQTDGLDKSIKPSPCLQPLKTKPALLRQIIHDAGIIGLGGAGFPSAQKLSYNQQIDTLIINAAECEPYISCDIALIQSHANNIIQGVTVLQHISQAKQCIIALEQPMQIAFDALTKAKQQTNSHHLTIQLVPEKYPTGGEKQLIKVLTGIQIPAASLPMDHGILCQNIGTVYAIYQAIFLGQPLIERIITFTGPGIKQAKNLRVPMGTPVKHLINYCGGYHFDIQSLIMGGNMMGFSLKTDDVATLKTSNCFLALNTLAHQTDTEKPCIRCGECEQVCPVQLLPQQLYWYAHSQQFSHCESYQLFNCIECGCCNVVCPSHIPLVQYFQTAKTHIKRKQHETSKAQRAKQRFERRKQRELLALQEKQEKAAKRQAAIDKMKAAAAARKIKNNTDNPP